MALTLAQFAVQENAFPLGVSLSATLAGDYIVCIGYSDGTPTSLATNLGDNATFLPINGVTSPRNFSGTNFFVAIISPTVGSTSVTCTFAGGSYSDMACYVVRGATSLTLDQCLLNDITSATTLITSGLTAALAAAAEFAISLGASAGSVNSINTAQSGSANFSFDTITGNGTGYAHQITATNAQLQAAWDTTNSPGQALVVSFYDAAAGGAAAPFSQADWPTPVRRRSDVANLGYVDGSEFWLFAGTPAAPFAGSTQPNPVLRARDVSNLGYVDPSEFWLVMPIGQQCFPTQLRGPLRTIAHDGFTEVPSPSQLLTGAKPFALLNQPNPVLRRGDVSNLGLTDPSEFWLFSAIVPQPFSQTDWPVPKGPAPRLNGGVVKPSTPDQLLTGDKPFAQNDWPTPRASGRLNAGFIDAFPNRTVTVAQAPFAQYDWPIPRGRQGAAVGFVASYAVNFLQPASQTDWPLPLRRSPLNTGFVSSGLAAGVPYSLDAPFAQFDWPVPRGRGPLNAGFVSSGLSLVVAPPPPAPVAQDDWPLPGRGRPPLNVGFTVAGLANGVPYSLDAPFKQTDWPVPAGRAWTIRGFVQNGLALTAVNTPFVQSDWQLPVRGAVTQRGFVSSGLALTTPPAPFSLNDWPVPKAARGSHVGFVSQADALRFQLLAGKPFAQNDWPNPVRLRTITVASSMRPSQNVTIRLPVNGYVPRSDGAALLI